MFVATGARANVIARRTEEFFEQYVKPLALEARKLGISKEQLNTMIERSSGLAPDSGTDKERSAAL